MQPAIIPGETVLLNKVIYNLKPPKRFDIVYFVSNDGRDNIKRIIGLPRETIQIKESKVYINGIGLEGDYSDVTLAGTTRSEERRVGKECRSRWSPYH